MLLGLLDEAEHVAHAQDARRPCAPGSKGSNSSTLSPTPANLTGQPVTAAAESAAPPRASPSSLREDDAGDADAAVELLGALHRVLAGHGVGHVEDLAGLGQRLQLLQLGHQLVVDVQAARGVHEQEVVADGARLGEGRLAGSPAGSVERSRDGGPSGRPARPACGAARARPAGTRRSRPAADGGRGLAASAPSLAVVVVLPEPCRPVIRTTEGGLGETWRLTRRVAAEQGRPSRRARRGGRPGRG